MAKLHIPAPDHEVEEAFGILELATVICLGLAATIFYSFATQKAASTGPSPSSNDPAQKVSAEVRRQQKLAASLDELKSSDLTKRAWKTDELVAVIRHGQTATSEAMCQAQLAKIREGALEDTVLIELVKAVDRRARNAPYACLSRLHFAGELAQKELAEELQDFWAEVGRHEGDPRLVAAALTDFRESRDRPDAGPFYAWLRGCAFDDAYGAAPDCQRLLRQISPKQGRDMLEAVEKQLDETTPTPQEMERIIRAVGRMARNGQPEAWKILETDELPDYDVDFRQGSVFYLCRFVNTPDDTVAEIAAEELADTGRYGSRGFDDKLRDRWTEACRLGFGSKKVEDETAIDPALQLLAVWDGAEDHKPDYRLTQDIARGVCKVRDGYPMWYCGSHRWNGEGKPLYEALQDFFVETRYIETQDWPD